MTDETHAVTLTYDEWVTVIGLVKITASRDSHPDDYRAIDIKIRRALGITA